MLDVATHTHRTIIGADVGIDRRATPRAAVGGKALNIQSLRMKSAGQQIACGLSSLATAALNDDLKHLVVSFWTFAGRHAPSRIPIAVYPVGFWLFANLGALMPFVQLIVEICYIHRTDIPFD